MIKIKYQTTKIRDNGQQLSVRFTMKALFVRSMTELNSSHELQMYSGYIVLTFVCVANKVIRKQMAAVIPTVMTTMLVS